MRDSCAAAGQCSAVRVSQLLVAHSHDVIEPGAAWTGQVVRLAAPAGLAVIHAVATLYEVLAVARNSVQTAGVVVTAAVTRVVDW